MKINVPILLISALLRSSPVSAETTKTGLRDANAYQQKNAADVDATGTRNKSEKASRSGYHSFNLSETKVDEAENNKRASTSGASFQVKPKDRTKSANITESNSRNDIQTNIVGGDDSAVGEFPYYVDMSGCGGTLIAPNVVLGAAHCGGYAGSTVYVSGYEYGSTSHGTVAVRVVAQQRHPAFNSFTMENDFYLYRLEEEVFPDTSVTLSLNANSNTPSTGEILTVLGLGTLYSDGPAPDTLMDVEVPTVSNSYCSSNSAYGNEFVASVMLCAGDIESGNKDSCQGDSGGPIVIRNGNSHVLVGVVSWGYGCGDARYPGVYARVSSAMEWIESVVCDSWNSNADFCDSSPVASPTFAPVASPTPAPLPNPTPVSVPSPTLAPVTNPTPAPQANPTGEDCTMLQLNFKTDGYPEESSFFLEGDGEYAWDENDFNRRTEYSYETCVPNSKCFTFDVSDTYGDGLLADGYLELVWDGNVVYHGWEYGYGFTWDFGEGCGSNPAPTSAPQAAPTPSSQPDTSCIVLELAMKTDRYPEETSFFLENSSGRIWDEYGFSKRTEYSYEACIPTDGCTTLDVTDTYGDGFVGDGYFMLTWDGDVIFYEANIGYGFTWEFGYGC